MAEATNARSLMERARHGAFDKLDAQRERAATGVGSVVDALRESSRQLQGQNATAASVVDSAATQLERFSGGIRDRDMHQIVREVEGFAREHPAIFIGSSFALGLATARFLKSSGPEAEGIGQAGSRAGMGVSGVGVSGTGAAAAASTWPDEPVAGRTTGPLTPGATRGTTSATERSGNPSSADRRSS